MGNAESGPEEIEGGAGVVPDIDSMVPRPEDGPPDETTKRLTQAYYDENQDRFMTAESVELDYVELRAEDFFEDVAEEDIQAEYDLTLQDYQYATERRVSHILFEDSDAARIAEAQAELESGADFAEIAKRFSDDVGSAGFGGDLGFTSGDAFPEEMEEAIEQLAVNAVSGPVETDAGTHLLLVTEIREGEAPPLESMRAQLERQVQERDAAAKLVRAVEQLRDLSFNAETLDAPAQELGLTVAPDVEIGLCS